MNPGTLRAILLACLLRVLVALPLPTGRALQAIDNNNTTPASPFDKYGCTWRTFDQTLDHFDANNTATFQQRYVVCPKAWPSDSTTQAQNGSVVVYIGSADPLEQPKQPIIFENIGRLFGLLIEIEHRYYGDSMPFTPDPSTKMLTTEQYQWLTMENAMEDTKSILESVRKEFNVSIKVPTLVIGGGYGGQLAAYIRVSYPDSFQAAIASSAPVRYVLGTQSLINNAQEYHNIVGESVRYATGNTSCARNVRTAMNEIIAANGTDFARIATSMDLCGGPSVLTTSRNALSLIQNLYYAWAGNAVQDNGQASGKNPSFIKEACRTMEEALKTKPGDLPAALSRSSKFILGINQASCYPFDNTYVALTNPVNNTLLGSYMYQCCTQGTVDQTMFLSRPSNESLVPPYDIPPPPLPVVYE